MNYRQFFTTNHWWGKLIGCFLGYLMTRSPLGGAIGILIGNFFDRGLANYFSSPHWHYHEEKREIVQKIFFEATFTIMGMVAKSDGRVSENEIQGAKQLMKEMRLGHDQKKMARLFFTTGKSAEFNPTRLLILLLNTCRSNQALLKLFLDIQYRYAQIDGLNPQKTYVLDSMLRQLGFSPLREQYRFYEDFSENTQQNKNSKPNPYSQDTSLLQAYALLEIDQSASKQEVKRAYRRLISANHPDKLIAKGLPEKMIKIANEKTQRITKAYDLICSVSGW